LTKYFSTKNV